MSGLSIFLIIFFITFIILFSINIILYFQESSYFKSLLIFSAIIIVIMLFFLFVMIFMRCIPKPKHCRIGPTIPCKKEEITPVRSCNTTWNDFEVDSQMTINQVQNIKNKIENIKIRIENEKDLDKILNLIDNSNKSLEKLIKIDIKDPILKKDIDKFNKRMSDFNIKMIS